MKEIISDVPCNQEGNSNVNKVLFLSRCHNYIIITSVVYNQVKSARMSASEVLFQIFIYEVLMQYVFLNFVLYNSTDIH